MKFQYIKLVFFVLQLFFCSNGLVYGSSIKGKNANILYVNSYKYGYYWSDQIFEGIESVVDNYPQQNLFIEYIDSKRIPLSLNSDEFIRFFENKYSSLEFQVIITSDNDALDFVLANRESRLFKNKPLVSCGISNVNDYPTDIENFFLIYEDDNITHTLDLIETITPITDTVFIFLDKTKTNDIYFKQLQNIYNSKKYPYQLKFIFSTNIEDLEKQVSSINEPSVIYYISSYQDNASNPVDPEFLAGYVAQRTNVPVFSGYLSVIIDDFIGGGLIDGLKHGQFSAEIAEKVLFDSLKSNKRQVYYPEAEVILNYMSLVKWEIDFDDIPQNAIIRKMPDSFYKKYSDLLYVIIPIIILLLVIIIILQKYNLDHKKIEIELINARNRADEANRLKSGFLANISHEFRTPLNSIIGFSDVIIDENVNLNTKEYVKIISENALRLDHILNHVFDFSLLEAHQIKVSNDVFSLREYMNEAYNELRIRNFRIKDHLQFSLLTNHDNVDSIIEADKDKIYLVLNHLVGNAFDFTNAGGISIYYEIANINAKQIFSDKQIVQLNITITDTGIGIDSEFKKIIFEPFRHVNEDFTNANRGVGLGLSICKSLVELMNGKIEFESELNKGSTFKILIPVKLINTTTILT